MFNSEYIRYEYSPVRKAVVRYHNKYILTIELMIMCNMYKAKFEMVGNQVGSSVVQG